MRVTAKASVVKPKRSGRILPISNIKVVGVGGGGGNAVSRMSRNFVRGVEFIAINTDHQDLDHCDVRHKIYIGGNLTRGVGAGMNPDIGQQAAEENRSEISEALRDADIVFVTAGMGGGTGGGAGPVIAETAKQSGALTIGVVTKPFSFEGTQRERVAQDGLARFKDKVDALIVVPNDRVFSVISNDTPVMKAFEVIDDILRNAVESIVELIVAPGIINVDFADIRTIVRDAGVAVIGVGVAGGQDRAVKAAKAALNSPLLDMGAEGARGVILAISGLRDLKMAEINEAAKLVSQAVDPAAKIIFGAYYDRSLKDKQLKVTLIATGFDGQAVSSLFGGRASGARFGDRPSRGILEEEQLENGGGTAKLPTKAPLEPREEIVQGPLAAQKKGKADKSTKRDRDEGYPWDIPTFLRKRRKR